MAGMWWKRNDTGPTPTATLKDAAGVAVNLTEASVRFIMSRGGTVKVDSAATIEDANAGQVSYTRVAADTDTAGSFRAEWEVTYSDGDVQTFPEVGWMTVHVYEDLA